MSTNSDKENITDIPINSSLPVEPLVKQEQVYMIKIDETNEPTNKWSGGLCDCFNNMYPSMCCSILTPNIYIALMYNYINSKNSFTSIILAYLFLNMLGYFTFEYSKTWSAIIFYSANLFMLSIGYHVRNTIRKGRNIPGSNCEDAFVTLFCTPCSLAQSGRTLYNHNKICDSLKFNNSEYI